MSTGSGAATDLATARGRDYPSVRQFSIFSPNKVGQLLALVRMIETAQIRVCALSVTESADCAIIRLVVNRPERAFEILKQGGYEFCEVDLLVVELPQGPQPMLHICSTLIQAELNIHFCFPLLVRPHGHPAMAFYVDDHETAAAALQAAGYVVLTEADLD